jgi:hypothetical protein
MQVVGFTVFDPQGVTVERGQHLDAKDGRHVSVL